MYTGRAAGSHIVVVMAVTTNASLKIDFGPGTAEAAYIYGAEYRPFGNVPASTLPLHCQYVPCTVCYVATRETTLMIPGTYYCPSNWTREYYGYLMAEQSHPEHRGRSTLILNVGAETAPAGEACEATNIFFPVEPRCGSLPCPPYEEEKGMTCAVCTR